MATFSRLATLKRLLGAAVCRDLPGREPKCASPLQSVSISEAGSRAFESRPGHHLFQLLRSFRCERLGRAAPSRKKSIESESRGTK